MQPETNYARLEGDRIGYQVFGHGPPDVVTTIGSYSHMDLVWEDPGVALYFRGFDQLWGTEAMAASLVPSRADDAQFRRWWARYQRAIAPPGAMAAFQRALADIDARPCCP